MTCDCYLIWALKNLEYSMRTQKSLLPIQYVNNQQGLALVMALMFIAVLTIMGSTAVTINSTDLLLGGAFQSSQAALHNADSGVNFVTSQVSSLVVDDKLKLDGTTANESYVFKKPYGFEFNIARRSTFKRISSTRKYLLEVTGRPRPNSPIKSTIEVVLQRRTALEYGLFSDGRLDLPARGAVYSYDSRPLRGRDPTSSTGVVKIGSNGLITAQTSHLPLHVDGHMFLGEDEAGQAAEFTFRESSPDVPPPPVQITTGEDHQIHLLPSEELASDPLDVESIVNKAQKRLQFKNDNDRSLGLRDYVISHSRYLREGNYYLKKIKLGTGKFLTLDARRADINIYADSITFEGNAKFDVVTDRGIGKVNIYLGGSASFGAASASTQPRVKVTGDATTFRIFSASSEPIDFYSRGDFKGFIYAPHAPVTIRNSSAKGYGLLWGEALSLANSDEGYDFYTDTALQETFLAKDVELLSWKEQRD